MTLSACLVLTRAADLYTTYLSTPDLKYEFNPLVSKLGLGWPGLICSQLIFIAVLMYALGVYCFKQVDTPTAQAGLSMKQFVSLFYFRNTTSFSRIFYKLPTNRNSFLYSIGYAATYTMIAISGIVSSSTYLLVKNKQYRDFYNEHQLWQGLYLLGGCLAIYTCIRFFQTEYRRRVMAGQ